MPWQLLPPLSLLWFHHPPMYLQLHPSLSLNLGVWGVTATTYFNRKHYTATKSFTNANFNTSSLLYQLIHIWIIYRFAKSKVYLFNWFTWLDLDQGWNLSAQIIECTQIRKTANISARHTSHISCPTHCEQSQNISHCEITAEPGCLLRGPLWPNWLDG